MHKDIEDPKRAMIWDDERDRRPMPSTDEMNDKPICNNGDEDDIRPLY